MGGTGGTGIGGEGGNDCVDDTSLPLLEEPPSKLSETGLYADISTDQIASYALAYHPKFELWSDGAEKKRYAYLPKCSQIDATNMDEWSFPVGTRFWKEFTVDGKRIETRLIHRFGSGPGDFIFAAYQWNDEGTDADRVPEGVSDAMGTAHDIPSADKCTRCHGVLPEKILGFGAIELNHEGAGQTLATLGAEGRLSKPNAKMFSVPGDPKAQAALGYLHANCGNCHNRHQVMPAQFSLRLRTTDAAPEDTDAYTTSVGIVPSLFFEPGISYRIAAGESPSTEPKFPWPSTKG